ncbi:hypothetical protein POM88_016304 [Heracleum sosnowskyi]|uniref:Uncharacterized protein n=1 Tax=Heracleum sosnowskyi TaxID=360622 RepID=A0AAD8MWS5_9APIA|nr:hypothetical protein POM88_016304 [Heracleum sosnowskyi]
MELFQTAPLNFASYSYGWCMNKQTKKLVNKLGSHEKLNERYSNVIKRYNDVIVGLNDTDENLFASVEKNEAEIYPSTLYVMACVLENVPFINGSPQNTFVPGTVLEIRWCNSTFGPANI